MRVIVPILLVILLFLTLAAIALSIWLIILFKPAVEDNNVEVIELNGEGIGARNQDFAYTRVRSQNYMFWWYFEADVTEPHERPLIVWLDGVVGQAPSVHANFLTFGPYDIDLNDRNGSWANDFNLLLIDAPIGQGFSYAEQASNIANTPESNANDIVNTILSFYSVHPEMESSALYLFGQGYGGRMALEAAELLDNAIANNVTQCNFTGIALGNPMIATSAIVSELGNYLEELGYIDHMGRETIENIASEIALLTAQQDYDGATQKLLELEDEVQKEYASVSLNINNIIDKNYVDATTLSAQISTQSVHAYFMNNMVAPSLGITNAQFDGQKTAAHSGLLSDVTRPLTDKLERILNETDYDVWIYNGNFDSFSNPLGVKSWLESMNWSYKGDFLSSPRLPFAVDGLLEGHTKTFGNFRYVWMNTAGVNVPTDSTDGFREILRRITGY